MPKFSFVKEVDIDRDRFFAISTNYEKFTEILPDYFKKLEIIEKNIKCYGRNSAGFPPKYLSKYSVGRLV